MYIQNQQHVLLLGIPRRQSLYDNYIVFMRFLTSVCYPKGRFHIQVPQHTKSIRLCVSEVFAGT